MAKQRAGLVKGGQTAPESAQKEKREPYSAKFAEQGIHTGAQFANLMSALMSDIISGRVTPAVGNAACNAGGKLLKVVDMQYRYGTQSGKQGGRNLILAPTADDNLQE